MQCFSTSGTPCPIAIWRRFCSGAANGQVIGISYSSPQTSASYDGAPLVTIPIANPEAMALVVLSWSRLSETDENFAQICDQIVKLA